MSLEQKINYQLNKFPAVKKVIKRVYQRSMYAISPKIKFEGNITRISPDDNGHEYFFGYYDKSPWDITDRYMLCMKANDTWSDVSPKEEAEILLIDTQENNKVRVLAKTRAWNVQQSCMLQWLGPDYSSRILYNDFRDDKYCSVILNVESGKEEKVISAPIYSVSADGKFALTLDFSRLYNLRPGYGYYNEKEKTEGVALPDTTAIWRVDLESGEVTPVLKYTDFANFEPRPEMKEAGSVHKVNHIMLSPNGKRFMVLYRWFNGHRKYTRLVTCDVDGTDMYVLSDDDMVSHCFWKNDNEILAFENKKDGGPGYYLMRDKTQEYIHCWPQFSNDGHPSYSPNGSLIVTDSYPDRARVASINLMDGDENKKENTTIARVFAPFKYDNDTRCDLHPRWNHAGNKICFDSVFEGHRGLYVVEVAENPEETAFSEAGREEGYTDAKIADICSLHDYTGIERGLISIIVPVYNVEQYLKRCISSLLKQSYSNIEIILVDDGSPDNCGILCDELAKGDSRIKVIHKTNGGLSSARNAGIQIATGKYITFVDSDDWIAESIYEKCIRIFEAYQCDVVDFKTMYTNGEDISNITVDDNGPIEIKDDTILYDYLFRGQTEQCPFSVCRKIYKRALLNEVCFPEGKVNEDIATNFKILSKATSLVHIADVGYYYFQNAQSITNGELKRRDFDLLDASQELCELSKELSDRRIYELAKVKLGRSYFSLLAKAAVGGISKDIEAPHKCIKELTRNLRKAYPMLMGAPISLNRKILITVISVNYRFVSIPVSVLKKLREMGGGKKSDSKNSV